MNRVAAEAHVEAMPHQATWAPTRQDWELLPLLNGRVVGNRDECPFPRMVPLYKNINLVASWLHQIFSTLKGPETTFDWNHYLFQRGVVFIACKVSANTTCRGSTETFWGYDMKGPVNLTEMCSPPRILCCNMDLWLMQRYVGGSVSSHCPRPVIRESCFYTLGTRRNMFGI